MLTVTMPAPPAFRVFANSTSLCGVSAFKGTLPKLRLSNAIVAAFDLPNARQARSDMQPFLMPRGARGRFVTRQGAWPHERHFAFDHVPKLRQFIDAGAAQPVSNARNAIVVWFGLHDRIAVFEHRHGAKLHDLELPAVESGAPLPEYHRSR